jgi:hypothetical protein
MAGFAVSARVLLEALMREARAHGFARMEGYVLGSNAAMLGLAERLGFAKALSPEGRASLWSGATSTRPAEAGRIGSSLFVIISLIGR